jgi:hypothetical protein
MNDRCGITIVLRFLSQKVAKLDLMNEHIFNAVNKCINTAPYLLLTKPEDVVLFMPYPAMRYLENQLGIDANDRIKTFRGYEIKAGFENEIALVHKRSQSIPRQFRKEYQNIVEI